MLLLLFLLFWLGLEEISEKEKNDVRRKYLRLYRFLKVGASPLSSTGRVSGFLSREMGSIFGLASYKYTKLSLIETLNRGPVQRSPNTLNVKEPWMPLELGHLLYHALSSTTTNNLLEESYKQVNSAWP